MTTPVKVHPSVNVSTDLIQTGPWLQGKLVSQLTNKDMVVLWPDRQQVPANKVPATATVFVMPTRAPRFADTVTWPT